MPKCWQLNALMRKNLILMKRSCCATCCEMIFPILLMLLLVAIRKAVKTTDYTYTITDDQFLATNSSALIKPEKYLSAMNTSYPLNATLYNTSGALGSWNGLTVRNPLYL